MILPSRYLKAVFFLCFLFYDQLAAFGQPSFPQIYESYMELGRSSYQNGNYRSALGYFKHASIIDPSSEEALYYLSVLEENENSERNVVTVTAPETDMTLSYGNGHTGRGYVIDNVQNWQGENKPDDVLEEPAYAQEELEVLERVPMEYGEGVVTPITEPEPYQEPGKEVIRYPEEKEEIPDGKNFLYGQGEPIKLDARIASTQPGTQFKLELGQSLILEGENISRTLIIDPQIISLEELGQDQVMLTGKQRGSSYLHVWDDQRRWTFNIEVILPVIELLKPPLEDVNATMASPLRMAYSIDWDTYYRGTSWNNLHNESLEVLQWMGASDETPYGDIDGYMTFNKYYESTELIGYGIGLNDGHVSDFKDFSLRVFDTSKQFSPLSLPGKWFRGVRWDAMAFDRKLAYSYIYGRDKRTYGLSTATNNQLRESYLDGIKAVFFPLEEDNFSFNFARGYGEARDPTLKDKVFSIEGQKRFSNILSGAEIAYDEDVFAYVLGVDYKKGPSNLYFKFRDIDKSFVTITGRPSNSGEVGGLFSFNQYFFNESLLHGYLDIYRDRFLPNEDNPNGANFDFNTSYEFPVTDRDRVWSGISCIYTPQEFSERNDLRAFSSYTKNITLANERDISWSFGGEFQRARFPSSPESEYDRYSLETGIRIPLARSFSYFWNYQWSWLEEFAPNEWDYPAVMNTGINMSKRWNDFVSGSFNLIYRDEERTGGRNSFLAGEDSLSGSVGFTYTPARDVEIYLDTRLRNIWAENDSQEAYNDFDVRGGLRSAWDTPLIWNPKGTIRGYVFKDDNRNHIKDVSEEGIEDVMILVGNDKISTWKSGRYQKEVSAKKVKVAIDMNTVPPGYVFTTPLVHEVEIIPWKPQTVHFGLIVQTGIYGVVFVDTNENGQFDEGETRLSRVLITLDEADTAVTDFEGTYLFRDIKAGKHMLVVDINSLPVNYLPTVKLKNDVEVAEGTTYVFHVPVKDSEIK